MPLPPSGPREPLHARSISMCGYRRADGLYDVEAHLIDTKTRAIAIDGARAVAAGEPIHAMWVRLVIDKDLLVVDVAACTDAAPYPVCPQAARSLQSLKGLRIGAGWSAAIRERLGGHKGCTHLSELLKPLATVAIQTLMDVRLARPETVDIHGRPRKIDSCYAYASDGDVVQRRWPQHAQIHSAAQTAIHPNTTPVITKP